MLKMEIEQWLQCYLMFEAIRKKMGAIVELTH